MYRFLQGKVVIERMNNRWSDEGTILEK